MMPGSRSCNSARAGHTRRRQAGRARAPLHSTLTMAKRRLGGAAAPPRTAGCAPRTPPSPSHTPTLPHPPSFADRSAPPFPNGVQPLQTAPRLASACRLRARRTLVLGVPTHNVGVRRNRCLDCHRKSARRGSEQRAGQQPSSTVASNRRTGNPRRAAPLATVAAPTPPPH